MRTWVNSLARLADLFKLDQFVSQLLIVCLRQNFVCGMKVAAKSLQYLLVKK